ncbi:helix-turn-helix domain-containing protein [Pelagibacterium sediminicola]|uniref:helix-turn-helix domain-containing protein n=1 Tax=Pelagibacterium sediminicola TaxID=2248761 RepID=UPI000E31D9E7|nr:AraC family transcriptional regulator [Pelagibacterium sediminicola]
MDSEALEVVGSLYAAATGEEGWNNFLCRLADFCGAENAALVRADQLVGQSSVLAPRADPAVTAAYNERWWAEDPTSKATATAPVGRITSLDDTGRELFYKSTFHNEFWAQSGLGAERLAVNLSLGRYRFASCVLQTSAARDELGQDARKRFAHLTPHLIRGVAIHGRLHRLAMENVVLSTFRDRPRIGLIVVDPAMRVLFADEAGEAQLAGGVGLRVQNLVFSLGSRRANRLLQRAVAACAGNHHDLPAIRDIVWNRGGGHRPLSIEVLPWTPEITPLDFATPRPAAILLLHDRHTEPDSTEAEAQALDGTSPLLISPGGNRTRAELFAAITGDIAANLDDCDISLAWLAKRHAMTPRRIRDLFYAQNTNFTDYLLNSRLDRARDMLTDSALAHVNIATIALDCGFGDISWFHHAFRRRFHKTPADMRRQKKDEQR